MKPAKLSKILVFILLVSFPPTVLAETYLENNFVDIRNNINISASTGNNKSNSIKNGKVELKAEVSNEINGENVNSYKLEKSYDTQNVKIELKNEISSKNNEIKTENELKINDQVQILENKTNYKKIEDNPKDNLKKTEDNAKKIIEEMPAQKNDSQKKADLAPVNKISDNKNENIKEIPFWKKITANFNNFYKFISTKIKHLHILN
ncbi:MAG: hypothetical protein UT48_C0003G0025 [Parcubacteria group bacterium GW2011_GWE2_39_37]|uniref:Uncharacterized protein n=1 Tax=Candidatus Falkowbacteria bacterium GW2011_GWF2_39_8 TaxID=1618642 RepID=A0A0G0T622_9BACT|nr:MAG: hypothetical protein UT48_C0003G0025 [Parcubacteria group bacterium GW2011_GWE2_39_37]KKR33272.1 MAG: hypothetical protein UT64_C0011G0005 [Candidatus Falkowbacteria bacterium GW2011_GWF2_39_8]